MSKQWCVYASSLRNHADLLYAPGDGIAAPSRRLYAVCDSEAQVEARLAELEASREMQRPLRAGDNRLRPDLQIDPFDPLDFVGSQNRDEYTSNRLAALRDRLIEQAAKNAADLMG